MAEFGLVRRTHRVAEVIARFPNLDHQTIRDILRAA